jgi:hypothetical protein
MCVSVSVSRARPRGKSHSRARCVTCASVLHLNALEGVVFTWQHTTHRARVDRAPPAPLHQSTVCMHRKCVMFRTTCCTPASHIRRPPTPTARVFSTNHILPSVHCHAPSLIICCDCWPRHEHSTICPSQAHPTEKTRCLHLRSLFVQQQQQQH